MLKILKNLKQSWLSVLIIVLLLCLQAAVDLELPNYTKAKAITYGIKNENVNFLAGNWSWGSKIHSQNYGDACG